MQTINLDILFILGIGVFGGMLGAWFFQRIRVPQVVGYIVIGLIFGQSGLKLFSHEDIVMLRPFSMFALGIIGFLVGGELQAETFRKYARQFTGILLGEGLGAFVLVGGLTTAVMVMVTHNWACSVAAGIIFGAISSATDPASTIDVLWEYRSRGVLTTSVTAIVALDDALAMTLYGLGASIAEMLTVGESSVVAELGRIGVELIGAALLGALFAFLLRALLRLKIAEEKMMAFAVGLILLLISIASLGGMDVILAAMTLGCVLANMVPRRSETVFKTLRGFSAPVYALFFVLVGARLTVEAMPSWLWVIVVLYVVGRGGGKILGAWLGARACGGEPVVRRYLGLALFPQGGVAVGLSIMASHHLGSIPVSGDMQLGDAIIFGVTATTLIVQVLGPPLVKLAVRMADEIGRDVTEEDVVADLKVSDVMNADVVVLSEEARLRDVLQTFVEHDYLVLPVVDAESRLAGVLSMASLKDVLMDQDIWEWVVASDVMTPALDTAHANMDLSDCLETMRRLNIDQMPVVNGGEGDHPVGMLDMTHIRKRIGEEVIRRRQTKNEALAAASQA